MTDLTSILAMLLSLLGPAPKDMPQELILKQGDQIVAIGDSITQGGGYLKQADTVLAAQYPDLKLFTINEVFGGWGPATKKFFDDGAVFGELQV